LAGGSYTFLEPIEPHVLKNPTLMNVVLLSINVVRNLFTAMVARGILNL